MSKSIVSQFQEASKVKKTLIIFGLIVLAGLPFEMYNSNKAQQLRAAQWQAMTPEQQQAIVRADWCRINPEQCAKVQDAEVAIYRAQKAAKQAK